MSALSAPAGGGTTTQTKPSTGKIKFQKLDINNLYCHSRGENSEPSSTKSQLSRKHGMQSLGKVPSARRPPANLPSLKTESEQDSTPNSSSTSNQAPGVVPGVSSSAGSTAPTPSLSTTTTAAVTPVVNQPCPTPSNTSHQHASAFPVGWASLPPHRTTQFQHEFPSLDGEPLAAGPSLRPQTEGSWTAGGSRPGVPDGPVPGGDSRPSQFNRTLVPNFMYKGSTGAGGPGGYPPAMMAQGPSMSGSRQAHGPLSRGPQRTRDVPGSDKMVQKPIICEEDLRSMDEISRDTGWATHDDIDYNQKLNFSDDESPSKDSPGPNRHHKQNAGGGHATRTMDKDTMDKRHPQPSIIAKSLEDDEVWEMRQRQHSCEVAVVIERAKQRKQQNERRYQEEQRQQEAAKQKSLSAQSITTSTTSQSSQNNTQPQTSSADWDRNKEQDKPIQYNKIDKPRESERSGSHPPVLNRSTSRDNVRPNNEQSEFRQMSQIGDGRVIKDQKDRERGGRERDYHRERDFHREKEAIGPSRIERVPDRDRDSDRGSDRDRERNRDHPRTERERDREMRSERDTYFKPFHADVPPRFLKKQQGRGGHNNFERMSSSGSDRGDFNRGGGSSGHDGPANPDNEKQSRRNDENKAPMPFGQYESRWNFPNSKSGQSQNNQRNENFHNSGGKRSDDSGSGKGGSRRNRTDSEISNKECDKVDDRRRERHTPDEPRHPRHPPRKLSGSSDTRHSSNREFSDRDDDYRWEKDHERRSGSNYDEKQHPDYVQQRDNSKDSSYDWRAEKDFSDKQNRNFNSKEMDRQSSRESQKDFSDFGKKGDSDRKSVENYDQKLNSGDKLSEVFDRKCSVQEERKSEINDRNSVEKSEKRDEKHDSNKLSDMLDSGISKMSIDSSKDNYDKDNVEKIDSSYESYEKDRDNISIKSSKSSLERQFSDKAENNKSDAYRSSFRDHRSGSQKDYKSDSDDNKRGNYMQMHAKKNQLNSQKGDAISKENLKLTEDPNKGPIVDTVQVSQTIDDSSRVWADSNLKSEINIPLNENAKNHSLDSIKPEEKDNDNVRMELINKENDSGKERLERKLSSSGSEKKSNSGVRYRTDSGNSSKRGYSAMVYRGTNWSGRGDSRRRGGAGGRPNQPNRDSIYSESEISGDELNQQQHNNPDKRRNARSPKSHIKKSEKEDRNRNMTKDSTSQNVQGENRNYQSKDGANNNNQINQSQSRHENRVEGREAFAPRGEPSRRGRGGFRGRGTVPFAGYGPHSTKSPFGQTNVVQQSAESGDNEISKNDHADDKGRNKQQSLNAGIIGRERRNVPPRMQDKNPRNKGKIDGASGEEEAWETTSEHSEGGKNKINKNDNRQPGQISGANSKIMGEKKQNIAINQDAKGNQKQLGKDKKSDSKDNSGDHETVDDGFQEVRSKKNVKDLRGIQPPKEDVHPARMHKHSKNNENQRNNSSTRSSSEKSINTGGARGSSGPLNSIKINCPPNVPSHERQVGPLLNSCKSNNFEQRRQNNLPPRLVRQKENMRQKQQTIGQGFNSAGPNMDMNNVTMHASAWDKPINQTLRGNLDSDQIIPNSGLNTIDCPEMCLADNHSGHSSQRSTPNISTVVDQKSAGSLVTLEKSGLLDGSTTPVQTIIFENTNYKSAPDLKQKFVSPGIGQQPNTNGNSIKGQQCVNPKSMGPIHQQTNEIDSQILGFTSDSQQTGPFITDLINSENNQPPKQDASPIQIQMSFGSNSKPSEDSSDMKLDFTFDPELSQLTEDKGTKPLGLSRSMHAISSSQNSMSLTTDRELNLKIASVKKVWDNTSMPTVIEHPTSDEVTHVQHNLNSHNMSVSSPHSLSSQHNINAQHISSHNLTSQHNMTSQHNLSQQLTSPHGIAQHNLGLGSQHNMNSNAAAAQFNTGFEDHQTVNDVGQSQGFSPSGNAVNNQTTNVCKVKPTQQPLHSAPGMAQNLQNMQAALMNQNLSQAATALQSMGNMQGVGGVMGLSPPPMQHAFNHINYQSQYGGIPAIPSPPTVVFNSSQQLINTSQQMSSQPGLYGPFPIDQTRNQYGGFPGGPYGAGSAPYNYTTPDMFQGLPNQYRMQDLFQAGNAAFGQSGQLATNPNTVLISSSSNSLMSASVKPSNQPIGAIGTKGTSYQGQQYLSYGAPHEAQPPPPYATALPPPSIVRTGPQAPPPPPPPLQTASTYYSQNAGNQTGFYQQTGNVSANYGIPFGQPNQTHNNTGIQGFSSQVLPSFQMAAAIQQYGRAQHPQAYVGAGAATGKQDHNSHLTRPQQLKSPLQDHQSGMFGVANMAPQGVVNQATFGAGAPSPKGGGTPNSSMKGPGSGYVGGQAINQQMGGNKQGSQQSPPHHKYQPQQPPPGQPYQHMPQVIQPNGRQASLNMAISRSGMQQRYPSPIQRPLPPQSQQLYNNNRGGGNRHQPGNAPPHSRHTSGGGGGYYSQNNRSNPPTVVPQVPTPEQQKPPPPVVHEEPCTPPTTVASTDSPAAPPASTPPTTGVTATEAPQEKKAE